jgi:geranylgeranyl diphosphate synthase type I
VRAAAALELFHTFALIHDDVMDESDTRRGVPTTHALYATRHAATTDPVRFGRSVAVLTGDFAAVLADRLLLDSGFPRERLLAGLRRYERMKTEVACGQLLDVAGSGSIDEARARRVATLKTGAYTVEGPLQIGAILAGGPPEVLEALSRYAEPLGQAFQLRDDVLDRGEGGTPGATIAAVNAMITRAGAELSDSILGAEAAEALRSLAGLLRLPEA